MGTAERLRRAAIQMRAESGPSAITMSGLSRKTGCSLQNVFDNWSSSDLLLFDLELCELLD
jgi:hypothetical protein